MQSVMKFSKYIILLILILLFFLVGCEPNNPLDHLTLIQQKGIIRVGTTPDYPPFEYLTESGVHGGFDIDLMSVMAQKLGVKLEWVDYPFENLVPALQRKEIDMVVSAFYENNKAASKIDFSDAYFFPQDALVCLPSSGIVIQAPGEVRKYKTGVMLGSLQDGWLTTLLEKDNIPLSNHIARYEKIEDALHDLQGHNNDLLMLDQYQANKLANDGNLKILYKGQISASPIRMVLPKGDMQLQKIVNSTLQELIEDGTINHLIQKHFE
jgi:polar amino acid transport system substrate-binding protein